MKITIQATRNSDPENLKTNHERGCWESVYKSAAFCIKMTFLSLDLALSPFSENKTAALAVLQH